MRQLAGSPGKEWSQISSSSSYLSLTEIETTVALNAGQLEVVYDERMDDDERKETAFSCSFHDKAGSGVIKGMFVGQVLWQSDQLKSRINLQN